MQVPRLPFLILALLACRLVHAQATDSLAPAIEQQLASEAAATLSRFDAPGTLETLRSIYAKRGYAPLWLHEQAPTPQASALVAKLRAADTFGLRVADYDSSVIESWLSAPTPSGAAQFEVALSASALRFVGHLHSGRIDPADVGFELTERRAALDASIVLEELAGTSDLDAALGRIEPHFLRYQLLKTALARYRSLAAANDLPPLPAINGPSVKPGAAYAGVDALRRRLIAFGDLDAAAPADSGAAVLDESLVAGLKSFQERHGLAQDGALGKQTYLALTVPLEVRVRQIELTLERWRWLPEFETPPILVNLPLFRLFAFRTTVDREADILQMDVIVGQTFPRTQSPVFAAQMKYLVFRPYWDMPRSIVQRETLPKIRANPDYLAQHQMELVRGQGDDSPVVPATPENIEALAAGKLRLRQQPGPENALGAIKFMAPNAYNVYLHSTPAQQLFQETRRAYSHGCIRVSDPAALALHILKSEPGEWTPEKIAAALNGPPNQRVYLTKPIELMILYGTASATESGRVRFFEDLYGHDRKLDQVLKARND